MLSTYMNEPRKEFSRNQGETSRFATLDPNFNTPMGSNNFIPKVDMHKFDGKDPLTWIDQIRRIYLKSIKS